ncbi:lipid A export permease/ATP-binding protein MsbA [Aquabacterium sp. A7-Y]|uniref:lipid A export permease/ATP-binding protein MsbA n=1 Tax=Aquabacterium sp. A7-Y TaxID=1349605 RepID=UPI00223DD9A8|nr:lipid A export permease/ATP-binding protein MsbA [Aquabacterium sp. A7-Y]MCW7536286.1 lipid A export permease/ATP-binding protein MsbA [Aquabacterium sp. A7-Y]
MNLKPAAKRLLAYIRPHGTGVILGVICFFLSAAIEPLVPALFKALLDSGFKADLGFPTWLVPVVIIGLFATRGLLAFTGTYLFNWSTSQAVMALRTDLVTAVMRADASLYSRISPGVAATKVINDPQSATGALASALTSILRDGTTLVALLGYLFYLNWKLTLISLVTMPLLGFVVRRVHKRVMKVGGQSYESQVKLVGIVDDITRAWRVVRTFDAGDFERRRFADEAAKLRRATLKSVAAGAMMTPLTQVVASTGVALILTLALIDANKGATTVGEFVAFITAMLMTISPMRHLTDVTQPIINGLITANASFELMDTPPEPDSGTQELETCSGAIQFDHVSVVYQDSEQKALNGLDLAVPAGQTIALVGSSGAGKTTAVSALLGFVAPTAGTILLDNIDVQTIRKASLRKQFAVVSQDIVLFDGSIADNVAYAQPKDADRIEATLKAANLWEFVEAQPDGVNTMVGTNGSRLSGGQRQRLAIARALYKNAKVWIFDEATSALDTESERIVQQSIEQWHGEKTLILIAHRLSTVRNADRIYVLSDGRVVEAGTHKELMERGGLYAGMVAAQAME